MESKRSLKGTNNVFLSHGFEAHGESERVVPCRAALPIAGSAGLGSLL